MGLFSSKHAYKWVMPADVSYNSQDGTTDYKSLPFVSFNYDSKTQSFSCPEHGFMANYGYRLIDLEMQVMMQPTFRLLVEEYCQTQKNPVVHRKYRKWVEIQSGLYLVLIDIMNEVVYEFEECVLQYLSQR